MTGPEDAGQVLTAIRLGWCIAEVRGRNRPDAPPGADTPLPGPPGYALPLHIEQTAAELRIQAQAMLIAMAGELKVDSSKTQPSFSQAIDGQAARLAQARQGGAADPASGPPVAGADDAGTQWQSLQELIFEFDQHIQDTMVARPDTVACGYQLGRALAEPYWALDPTLGSGVQSPAAWWFLLGAERCGEMGRLAGRLSAYFHPLTAAAIAGSLQIWKHVAADERWRANAEGALYSQIRRWYELVVMGQDPTTLVQPYALTRNFRVVFRALRIFWPELVGAAVAAGALSGFAVALGQHSINGFFKSALGFIAIAGFSLAGLTARLKNQAQAMVTRLRQDVYTDLVAVAISTAPPAPPEPGTPARQRATMSQMVRERAITPVTPN